MKMKTETKNLIIVIATGLSVAWYIKSKTVETAAAVANAVNPLDEKNIFNQAVQKTGQALTGDADWSLGSQIYEWLNGEEERRIQAEQDAEVQAILERAKGVSK